MIELRPYQLDLVKSLRNSLRTNKSVLLQAPTGCGKTAMAAYIIFNTAKRGNKVFFICHRQELLDQTARTFQNIGITYFSFIASGYFYDSKCPIQICSIQTLKNRLNRVPTPDIIVWDEVHHVAAAGWSAVKNHYAKSYHVGLSATPQRLDGKGLSDHFGSMVQGPTVEWLIKEKYLSDYDAYCPGLPDLSSVHSRMGDYVKAELDAAMDKSSITGDIIKHWLQHAKGKRTIGFAVSVKHSMHLAEQCAAAGIRSIHLDGTSDKSLRRATAKKFAAGEYDIIWNVDLFGEGYDLSAQADSDVTVDCVILARPTQSLSIHLQQVGRALRPKADGSKAIILDHAGNCLKQGLPDTEREWSLTSTKKSKASKDAETDIPIRQCNKCFALYKPAPVCPYCGNVSETKQRKVEERSGDLEKIDKEKLSKQLRHERAQAGTLEQLISLGMSRGYKNPTAWAAHVWSARQRKGAGRYEKV